LIPHQRQERADDDRRSRTTLSKQFGRDEINRALAPPSALNEQQPFLVIDESIDRFPLIWSEIRFRTNALFQQLLCLRFRDTARRISHGT
jgi:hypothetical protein